MERAWSISGSHIDIKLGTSVLSLGASLPAGPAAVPHEDEAVRGLLFSPRGQAAGAWVPSPAASSAPAEVRPFPSSAVDSGLQASRDPRLNSVPAFHTHCFQQLLCLKLAGPGVCTSARLLLGQKPCPSLQQLLLGQGPYR
jgi:hypothetical protein